MQIDLYRYFHTIPLSNSKYTGKLENVTMFSDTLVLHQNVDNKFYIKITDRDRVTYTLPAKDKVPSNNNNIQEVIENQEGDVEPTDPIETVDDPLVPTIKFLFRVIDERKVVISKFYLDYVEQGKYFEAVIPKIQVNALKPIVEYSFMVTLEEVYSDGTIVESPLYTDHDFAAQGTLIVHENFKDLEVEEFTLTEPYILTGTLGEPTAVKEGKHFFNHIILNDSRIYNIEIISLDGEQTCSVSFEVNTQTHYPLNARGEQWRTKATFYDVGVDVTSILKDFPERVYARIVMHTFHPENFILRVTKTG